MKLKRIFAIFIKQLFLIRQNKTRLVNIFLWALIDIILWGFITKYLDSAKISGFSFAAAIMGAIIMWDFLVRVQQGIILTFFEDMWARNFLNIFGSPLSINEYALGLIVTSLTTSVISLGVMALTAWALFTYNIFSFGLYLIPFIAIIIVFGIALGIFTISLVIRFGPPAEWFAWIIPFILSPLVGVFYPISALPAALQKISSFLPPTYVFEGMRAAVLAGEFSGRNFLIGMGAALACLLAAFFFFTYIYKTALKSGLLSRFTAEN